MPDVCFDGWSSHWLVCDCMAVDHAFVERMRQKEAATANHGVNEEEGKDGEDDATNAAPGTTTATSTNTETAASPTVTRRGGRRANAEAPQG